MACLYCLTCTGLFYPQLMVVSVRGPDGQRAVRLVGLVPSLEADSVITPPLMLEDKTALGTSHRRKVVSLRHVLVSNHHLYIMHLQVKLKIEITRMVFHFDVQFCFSSPHLSCVVNLWKSIRNVNCLALNNLESLNIMLKRHYVIALLYSLPKISTKKNTII